VTQPCAHSLSIPAESRPSRFPAPFPCRMRGTFPSETKATTRRDTSSILLDESFNRIRSGSLPHNSGFFPATRLLFSQMPAWRLAAVPLKNRLSSILPNIGQPLRALYFSRWTPRPPHAGSTRSSSYFACCSLRRRTCPPPFFFCPLPPMCVQINR